MSRNGRGRGLFDYYGMPGELTTRLVIAAIGCCLYCAFIVFLFQKAAPLLLLGLSVYLSVAVSWICTKVFSRTYSAGGASRSGLFFGMAMLLLLYVDFLMMLSFLAAPHFSAAATLAQVLSLSPNGWMSSALGAAAGFGGLSLAGIALAIVAKGIVLPFVFLIQRGLECDDPDPAEPAYLSYFEKQAFRDLKAALMGCTQEIPQHIKPIAVWVVKNVFSGKKVWFLWPLGVTALLGLIPPLAFATLFLGSVVIIYGVALVALQAFNRYLALLLYLAESLVMKVRAGYAKCPHQGCHEPLPLPIMICACGAEHNRLLPGRTGIFSRRCRCGNKLPALFLLGKGDLASRCRKCSGEIPGRVFGANIHLPIYGGPEAGKTCLMAAGVAQLIRGGLPEIETGWLRDRDRIDFEQQWDKIPEGGVLPRKTADLLPNAYLMSLQSEEGLAASLYLYDPAGEVFNSGDRLQGHRYMSYCSGLLLVVDPLSFPEVDAEARRLAGGNLPEPPSARLRPGEVLDRVVQQLEGLDRLKRNQSLEQPVAVVVSKCDLDPLSRQLAGTADSAGRLSRQSGEAGSAGVRAWLETQDSAFVHGLETRFRNVRYFAVAAVPARPRPAVGRESVLAPLGWILSFQRVLTQPLLTRWSWAGLETGAFAGVAVVALAPPVLAVLYGIGWI